MFLIPDTAWKFGCGRYVQKPGALSELGGEVRRLGRKPLIISGEKAWKAAGEAAVNGLGEVPFHHVIHRGPCCEENARAYAALAGEQACDVIVGVGGGVIMDTAKLTADIAHLPVLTVPTISATCAAFAPLSVVYTPDGQTRGAWYYENEVNGCIADTDVLSRQPLRYAASGIADSLAKAVEIRHNLMYETVRHDLAFALYNAEYLFDRLQAIGPDMSEVLSNGTATAAVEEMVYLTIPVTGIISGAGRGRMQSAMGHALYESVRTDFTKEGASALHGELVGIGLRLQLTYDAGSSELIDPVMKALKLPMSLSDAGIPFTEENLSRLLKTFLASPFTVEHHYDVDRLRAAFEKIW